MLARIIAFLVVKDEDFGGGARLAMGLILFDKENLRLPNDDAISCASVFRRALPKFPWVGSSRS